jgi:hypothetical protein
MLRKAPTIAAVPQQSVISSGNVPGYGLVVGNTILQDHEHCMAAGLGMQHNQQLLCGCDTSIAALLCCCRWRFHAD